MPKFQDESADLIAHKAGHFGFTATKIDDLLASEYTLVSLVFDRSGSVMLYQKDMEECIKRVVKACQKSPRADNLMIRLVTFDNHLVEEHGFKLLSSINLDAYDGALRPGMTTALFDASVDGVESVANYGQKLIESEFQANAIVVICTDGWDNSSKLSPNAVKDALSGAVQQEKLESLVSILVGVNQNAPGTKEQRELEDFKDNVGFTQYVELKDADEKTLAKLADFISQSISSQSSSLGSGQASQPIDPSVVF